MAFGRLRSPGLYVSRNKDNTTLSINFATQPVPWQTAKSWDGGIERKTNPDIRRAPPAR